MYEHNAENEAAINQSPDPHEATAIYSTTSSVPDETPDETPSSVERLVKKTTSVDHQKMWDARRDPIPRNFDDRRPGCGRGLRRTRCPRL